MATPGTPRGRALAQQRLDASRGRYNERVMPFSFPAVGGGAQTRSATVIQAVNSLGGRFVRILAMRGTLVHSDQDLTGLELANLRLRVQLNAVEELIGVQTQRFNGFATANTASFAALFSNPRAPWYWYATPQRMRTGDKLGVTVSNTIPPGEGSPLLTATVDFWIMDEALYDELYLRAEERGA